MSTSPRWSAKSFGTDCKTGAAIGGYRYGKMDDAVAEARRRFARGGERS